MDINLKHNTCVFLWANFGKKLKLILIDPSLYLQKVVWDIDLPRHPIYSWASNDFLHSYPPFCLVKILPAGNIYAQVDIKIYIVNEYRFKFFRNCIKIKYGSVTMIAS
jgi:hypothetical protein